MFVNVLYVRMTAYINTIINKCARNILLVLNECSKFSNFLYKIYDEIILSKYIINLFYCNYFQVWASCEKPFVFSLII